MFLRRMAKVLSAGALAAGLSLAATGTANAEVPPSSDWNEIVSQWDHNFNNTLCIDDPSGSLTENTHLQLWHCNSNPNQRWRLEFIGYSFDGTPEYHIVLRKSLDQGTPMCVAFEDGHDISGGIKVFSGEHLVITSCDRQGPRVLGVAIDGSPGTNPLMRLRHVAANLCLAAADFSDNNGTPLIVKTCDSNDLAQVWWLG